MMTNNKLCRTILGLMLMILCIIGETAAAGDDIPIAEQVAMYAKALSFDRNISKITTDNIVVGVVYAAGDIDVTEIVDAFNDSEVGTVSDKRIKAVAVEFRSVEQLLKAVKSNKFAALYFHSSMAQSISTLLQVTRGSKVRSLASSDEMVKQGVSLGVTSVDGKYKIMVNLMASKVEGMSLSSQLLKVAEVIK